MPFGNFVATCSYRNGDARDVICKNQMVDIDKSVMELLV